MFLILVLLLAFALLGLHSNKRNGIRLNYYWMGHTLFVQLNRVNTLSFQPNKTYSMSFRDTGCTIRIKWLIHRQDLYKINSSVMWDRRGPNTKMYSIWHVVTSFSYYYYYYYYYHHHHHHQKQQHHSRELLMMGIVVPETCWAYKKYNKITSDI